MKKENMNKCTGSHDFYVIKSWYEREKAPYSDSTSYYQQKAVTYKVLVLCKKCGELRLLRIKDE